MSLKGLLTEQEVCALKQSVNESLGINLQLDEAKEQEFWRTVRGQKIGFFGIPDDGKPDKVIKGGSKQVRLALGGKKEILKKITDKVKNAKKAVGKARNKISTALSGLGKAGAKAKKIAMTALDDISAMSGVI